MASANRIDSIYDVAAIAAEQAKVEAMVKETIGYIREARKVSIDLNINTKDFAKYQQLINDLEKKLQSLTKAVDASTKSSTLLAKQKEAEAKAMLAQTKATVAATKETERQAAATKKAADAATEAQRPYKQLAMAFQAAAKHAQDLAVQYGMQDKRAQAAAKSANALNDRLKAIDASVGNHQRNVGNYSSAISGVGDKLKGLGLQLAAFAGLGSFFSGAIDEFISMDKNVRMLQNTLKNLGVPEAFARMEDSANKLATQFTYLDNDDLLQTFNQLAIYGKLTEDQINELIPVIIDFAAASGQDLAGATTTIIKALEGNGKALKEYGINIKDAKTTSEAFGVVMDQLAPKVEGVGQAFADSAAGGLASARQELKNLQEEVGGRLVPVLATLMGWLNKILIGLNYIGESVGGVLENLKNIFTGDFSTGTREAAETMARIEQAAGKGLAKTAMEGKSAGEAIDELNKKLVDFQRLEKIGKTDKTGLITVEEFQRYQKQIRVTRIALAELYKMQAGDTGGTLGGGDPNKPLTTGAAPKGRDLVEANKKAAHDIAKTNMEMAADAQGFILGNEQESYAKRMQAAVEFARLKKDIIDLDAEYEKNIKGKTETEKSAIDADAAKKRVDLERSVHDQINAIEIKARDRRQKELDDAQKKTDQDFADMRSAGDEVLDADIAKNNKALKTKSDDQKKADEIEKELIERRHEYEKQLAMEVNGFLFDLFTNRIDAEKNLIEEQIDMLELQKQKEIEVADQTIVNAEEKAAAIAVIEARAQAKREQLELRQKQLDQKKARYEKARAVAEIAQGTAIAVVGALGAKPWGAQNIALAAVVGALGAVQIARVLAQPIPKYAHGTEGHGGGLAIVGDGGRSEGVLLPDGSIYRTPSTGTLVDLPRGAKVFPDFDTMGSGRVNVQSIDTTEALKRGFGQVVGAIKRIPQPLIRAERAYTVAMRTGSNFRNYINRSI